MCILQLTVEIITVLCTLIVQPPKNIYGLLPFYFQLPTYQINGNGIVSRVLLDKVLFR